MKDDCTDPTQDPILQAAWSAFSSYGYRKTSMDDIARGAGMSRPALYLRYPNKRSIFRRLVQIYFDTAAEGVARAFATRAPLTDVLTRAFAAQGGAIVEAMLTSTHGMEVMDLKAQEAADIMQDGMARLAAVWAEGLRAAQARGQARLIGPPDALAATILAALHGIKTSVPDYATYVARTEQLAAIVAAGLEPR